MLTKPSIWSAMRLYVRKSPADSGGNAPSALAKPAALVSLPIGKEGREKIENGRGEREARENGGAIILCSERIGRQLCIINNYRVRRTRSQRKSDEQRESS